ncbi:MAG: EAL domain-containing protein [Sphingomonas sp.]|nr:MAG: EAL domain-containing protein [Sphingomonas sp.]
MGVVAEGVETPEQMVGLVEAGCTHLQGYLFSKPLHREEIRACLFINARYASAPVATALHTAVV